MYTNIYATNDQAATVIADRRVQGVSVTGSERAGAAVAEVAGRNLKKVALELGGSDPFILLSTDDLDGAVQAAVDARLDNTGQSCNAAKRFIVVDGLYDAFLEKFTAAMAGAKVGDPFADDTVLGPLSSLTAAERLAEQVDKAVAQGATPRRPAARATARSTPARSSPTSRPTWTRTARSSSAPSASSTGSPTRTRRSRSRTTPASASARTSSRPTRSRPQRVADKIDAGMVYVNVVLADEPGLPFGGVKRSGTSREMGLLAADEFVNKKLIRVGVAEPRSVDEGSRSVSRRKAPARDGSDPAVRVPPPGGVARHPGARGWRHGRHTGSRRRALR